MEYSLSDAEFVVSLLIREDPGINGYVIHKRAEERGLDAWAGVASSSIYNALKELQGRGLAASGPDANKQGRGPRGRSFKLTSRGRTALRRAIAAALEGSRENDPRFNIALAGLELFPASDAVDCLEKRAEFLGAEVTRLRAQSEAEPLPLSATLLFDRVIHAVLSERSWVQHAHQVITAHDERSGDQ